MSRRKLIRKEKYINVFNGINKKQGDMTYWTVIQDMDGLRQQFPVLYQGKDGTCVIFSIETAKEVATKQRHLDENLVCSTKIKKNGAFMKDHYKKLGISKNDYFEPTFTQNESRTKVIADIVNALEKGYVVVTGGNVGLPWDREYMGTMVPVFDSKGKRGKKKNTQLDSHNQCIIGYYNDMIYGPSFLTKMTNKRDTKAPIEYGDDKYLAYAIMPLKFLQGETNMLIVEYAIKKVKNQLKF